MNFLNISEKAVSVAAKHVETSGSARALVGKSVSEAIQMLTKLGTEGIRTYGELAKYAHDKKVNNEPLQPMNSAEFRALTPDDLKQIYAAVDNATKNVPACTTQGALDALREVVGSLSVKGDIDATLAEKLDQFQTAYGNKSAALRPKTGGPSMRSKISQPSGPAGLRPPRNRTMPNMR